MPAPLPSLKEAVDRAVEFTKRYQAITVRLYEVHKVGTPYIVAYEPFIGGMEPEIGKGGLLYTKLGNIKAGKLVSD